MMREWFFEGDSLSLLYANQSFDLSYITAIICLLHQETFYLSKKEYAKVVEGLQ